MSITRSQDERAQAKASLAAKPGEQLREDLAYWSVAKLDHQRRFQALTNDRDQVRELYAEADTWVDLIAEELAGRRQGRPS